MNGELPQRLPGEALGAIVPDEQPPAPANLFSVPAGEVVNRRFDAARLHRRPTADDSPSSVHEGATRHE